MELTFACSRLALAIFSRPEHTSLLPPSTAHRLFWAPAKDTAPVTHTHPTHALKTDSTKCYKPINSCPHTFAFSHSHRSPPPLTFLSSLLFSTPCSSLPVAFSLFFLFLLSLLTYISTNMGVRLITGPNYSTTAFLFPLSSLCLSSTPPPFSLFFLYRSCLHTRLTYKGGDADILPVVDPHDGRDDLVDEALRHTQLQQRIRERPPSHVDEATPAERVQQFFH